MAHAPIHNAENVAPARVGVVDSDLLGTPTSLAEEAFLDVVRRASERYLPCRGWSRLLEVGAGDGTRAVLLAERGYLLTIVDRDADALQSVRRRFDHEGLDARFVHADDLVRLTAKFDLAVCRDPSVVDASAARAASVLRRRMRARGLLVAGPGLVTLSTRVLRLRGWRVAADYDRELGVLRASPRFR